MATELGGDENSPLLSIQIGSSDGGPTGGHQLPLSHFPGLTLCTIRTSLGHCEEGMRSRYGSGSKVKSGMLLWF